MVLLEQTRYGSAIPADTAPIFSTDLDRGKSSTPVELDDEKLLLEDDELDDSFDRLLDELLDDDCDDAELALEPLEELKLLDELLDELLD